MFSKARRPGPFDPPPDTPGPNAYDPRLPSASAHKRGAMFDTEARTKIVGVGKQLAPDSTQTLSHQAQTQTLFVAPTPGAAAAPSTALAPTPATGPRASTTAAAARRRALGASTSQAPTCGKENATVTLGRATSGSHHEQQQLAKLTAQLERLQASHAALQNQLGDSETALRLAAQREAKLKASAEKAQAQAAAYKEKAADRAGGQEAATAAAQKERAALQAQFEALVQAHEEGKAKHSLELERARRALDALEEEKAALREACDATEKEVRVQREAATRENAGLALKWSEAKEEARALQSKLAGVEQEVQQVYAQLEKAEEARAAKASEVGELEAKLLQAAEERGEMSEEQHAATRAAQEELEAAQNNIALLSKLLIESQEQQTALRSQLAAVTAERDSMADQLQQAQTSLRSQTEELQHAASQLLIERNQVQSLLQDLSSLTLERQAAAKQDAALTSDLREAEAEKKRIAAERDDLLFQLTLAQKQAGYAHSETQRSTTLVEGLQVRVNAQEAARLRAEQQLAEAVAEVQTLQHEAEERERELRQARAERGKLAEEFQRVKSTAWEEAAEVGDLKEELLQARAELEGARGELHAYDMMLSQMQAKENYLAEQKADLEDALKSASFFEAAFHSLQSEVTKLLSRSALAEDEARSLSEMNAELLSHANPSQKIHHMDRIRRELIEVKSALVAAECERNEAIKEKAKMESELGKFLSYEDSMKRRPVAKLIRVSRLPAAEVGSMSVLRSSVAPAAVLSPRSTNPAQGGRRSLKASRISLAGGKAKPVASTPKASLPKQLEQRQARRSSLQRSARRTHVPYHDADGSPSDGEGLWRDEDELTLHHLAGRA